jgi:Methyltransferase domain
MEDGSIDVVISNGVIDLVPDKDAVFGEIDRVLRLGGRLQIADVVIHNEVSETRASASTSGPAESPARCSRASTRACSCSRRTRTYGRASWSTPTRARRLRTRAARPRSSAPWARRSAPPSPPGGDARMRVHPVASADGCLRFAELPGTEPAIVFLTGMGLASTATFLPVVGPAASPAPADPAGLDARHPFVADRREGSAGARVLSEVLGPLPSSGEPCERLAAVVHDRHLPFGPPGRRVVAAPAPGRPAPAARLVIVERGAPELMGHVDPGRPRLAPVRHQPRSSEHERFAPGDTRGDTNVSQRAVRWGPLGSGWPRRFRANCLQRCGKRPTSGMPEEGLEPPTRGL